MDAAELHDLFLAWAERTLAPRTVAGYRRYLTAFAAQIGAVEAGELRPYHLLTWGNTWHEIQAVQRCYQWAAVDAELIARNPFSRVKRPPLGQRRRVLSRGELARLLTAAARDFRRLLVAGRETMARPQELRALAWADIRWDERQGDVAAELRAGRAFFLLEEFKARRRRRDPNSVRLIPITRRLGRMLARLLVRHGLGDGPIFLNAAGWPWTKEAIRLRMKRLRRKLALGVDRRGEPVVFYTLRHTGATEAVAAGVRDRMLAEMMGHTSTRTTARYQHLDAGHLLAAMGKVEESRKKRRPGLRRSDDLGDR